MNTVNSIGKQFHDNQVLCVYRKDKAYAKKYRKLINNLSTNYLGCQNPESISEYIGSANHHIDLKKYSIKDYSDEDLAIFNDVIDMTDDLQKERIFRTHLTFYQAYDLLISCAKFFIEFFRKNDFKVIVMQSPDNYVGHTMVRIAKHFNIEVIGVCLFFMPGLVRINVFGEYNCVRSPNEDEVDTVLNQLIAKEKLKITFDLKKSSIYKEILRQFLTYKAKYVVHYLFLHKLCGKLEYDYIGTPAFHYPNKLANFFIGKFFEKNLSRISKLEPKNNIYIPLHVFPESTVEYWVDSPSVSPYYPSLYESIQKLSNRGFNVILKEHPAFIYKRDKDVYNRIKSIKNTYLMDPFVPTHQILETVDYVLVWSGTSGIEALIHDKKVVIASENYYSNGGLQRIENIDKAKPLDTVEKKLLIRRVLSNCLPISE